MEKMDDYNRYASLLEGFYRSCYKDVKAGMMASEPPQVQSAIATENALRSMLRLGCPERMLAFMVADVLKLDSRSMADKKRYLDGKGFPSFSTTKVVHHMVTLEHLEEGERMRVKGNRERMQAFREKMKSGFKIK